MRCNVPFCTSDSTRNGTDQDISFFSFPKDPNIRRVWVKALGTTWELNKSSFICSEHFRQEDYYKTTDGKRMLHEGVLPLKILDCDELAALRVCRICLVMDAKMYDFAMFDQMFEQITGILTSEEESRWLPQQLCWECAARLKAAADFREKAFISDSLLHDLLKTSNQLKIRDIKTINRTKNGLKTSLLQTVIDCEHYELNVKDTFVETLQNSDSENEIQHTENREEILETNTDNNIPVNNVPITNDNTPPIYSPNKNTNKLFDEFDYSDDESTENDVTKINNETELKDGTENNIIEDNKNIYVSKKNNTNDIVLEDANSDDDDMTDDKYLEELGGEDKVAKAYEHVDINTYVTKFPPNVVHKPGPRYHRLNRTPIIPVDETIFEIQQLSYDEQMKEFEARKESASYKNSLFKCTVCYKGFIFQNSYNSHVLLHNEENGAYECYLCMKRHKSAQSLRTHLLTTHTVQYNCRLCDFRTRHKQGAVQHVRLHQGKKYKCSLCPMEFQISSTYFGHLRFRHMLDWVCELCGFTFVGAKGLRQHIMKKHRTITAETPREGPYCEVCDIKFLSQEAHDTHLRVSPKHLKGESDPLRIRNEPSVFAARRSHASSGASHPKKRAPRRPTQPVTCEQCGLELSTFPRYELHFAREHPGATMTQIRYNPKPVMCEQCGQIFTKPMGLKQHMVVHTNEKQFVCDLCGKGFKYRMALASHLQRHLPPEERRNQCPTCLKYFASLSGLKKHLLTHTGVKPYQCNTCKKCFGTTCELRQHTRHVHDNVPWPRKKKKDSDK